MIVARIGAGESQASSPATVATSRYSPVPTSSASTVSDGTSGSTSQYPGAPACAYARRLVAASISLVDSDTTSTTSTGGRSRRCGPRSARRATSTSGWNMVDGPMTQSYGAGKASSSGPTAAARAMKRRPAQRWWRVFGAGVTSRLPSTSS